MSGKKEKNAETILVICTGLLIIFLITGIKGFVTVSALLGLIGIFSAFLSDKIVWSWNKLSALLGLINSKVLLSVIFFLFVTPIAFISRLMKGDILKLKKGGASYYVERNYQYTGKDIENTW